MSNKNALFYFQIFLIVHLILMYFKQMIFYKKNCTTLYPNVSIQHKSNYEKYKLYSYDQIELSFQL